MTESENEEPRKLVALEDDGFPIFCTRDCCEESIDRYGISNAFWLFGDRIECAVCGTLPKLDPSDEIGIIDPLNYGPPLRADHLKNHSLSR